MTTQLLELLRCETAGDPQRGFKWCRRSLRWLSRKLRAMGYKVSAPVVGRLVRQEGYGFRSNAKRVEDGGAENSAAAGSGRDAQFLQIERLRNEFLEQGCPVVSVDTKKKELIGNFKNAGQAWGQEAEAVKVHDFRGGAEGLAVPYGVYDVNRNRGTVFVGQSADTPEFAVLAIEQWYRQEGFTHYPNARRLLILADAGGSNSARSRLWKQQLQEHLCNRLGLEVTVCHYPVGCSKWNPIEHRLFSQISKNWAGHPLRSFHVMLQLIRGATTQTGLRVKAKLLRGQFDKGIKVSNTEMSRVNIVRHDVCPQWAYTLRPTLTTHAQ